MRRLTIGELAKAANVPVSTIRFYERNGILSPEARTGANYREYSQEALERLRFIRASQSTGFSIADIRKLLDLTFSSDPPCDEVITLAQNRLADVRQRLEDLKRVEKALAGSLEHCCKGEDDDLCGEISRMRGDRKLYARCSAEKRPVGLTLNRSSTATVR
jgi:DNA-binding transcriptional MerR regulator